MKKKKVNKELIVTVGLCRGALDAWHEWEPPAFWDAPEKSRSWVEYRDGGGTQLIASTEALCNLAHDAGCSLENDGRRAPADLATSSR